MRRRDQSGQVLVIVAVWLVALIGSAALILLAGSVEWQRNQVQQLADQAALDAALKIGIGCSAGSANTVITEADNFLATQRTPEALRLCSMPGRCTRHFDVTCARGLRAARAVTPPITRARDKPFGSADGAGGDDGGTSV